MHLKQSLMAQFILGVFILVLCMGALIFSHKQASSLQMKLVQWQSLGHSLQADVVSFQRQAQHYKLNAPRDFESYDRDVAVFYKQFQNQLGKIDQTMVRMKGAVDEINQTWIAKNVLSDDSPLSEAKQQQESWNQFWLTFLNNLSTEIGDVNEPRLEWGADLIIATQANLQLRLKNLDEKIIRADGWFESEYNQFNWFFSIFVLLIALSTLALFAMLVIRPIVSTTNVCKAVSAGEYGLKVEVNGTGETKQLQEAFNDLSSRSRLLIDLISDINKPGDVEDKLQKIYDSGKDALSLSWLGLMSFDSQKAQLHTSVPPALDKSFRHRHVTLHKSFGRELQSTLDSKWLDLPDLRRLSMKRHDERFLRELHKTTMAHHIVGTAFRCTNHNDFILLFACNLREGFSEQQIELIKTLSDTMSDGILAGLEYAQPAQQAV